MLKTEEEARECWCPYARNIVEIKNGDGLIVAVTSGNKFSEDKMSVCIASNCMAWRWKNASEETKAHMRAVRTHHLNNAVGYCGLAGEPSL